MEMVSDDELIQKALQARENAYAPYSEFQVGAAVLFDSGGVYTGCNVENSTYGATNCAERTAVFSAVAGGEVAKGGSILKVAVVGGKNGQNLDFCPPCGICLQVIAEFSRNNNKCEIVLAKTKLQSGQHLVVEKATYQLTELLPMGFWLDCQ